MTIITTQVFHNLLFLLQLYDHILPAGYFENPQPMKITSNAFHSSYS